MGFPVLMGESPFPVAAQDGANVVGWVIHFIILAPVAHLQDHAIVVCSILEMMCRAARWKARDHSRALSVFLKTSTPTPAVNGICI
jgi:hypothetical protein